MSRLPAIARVLLHLVPRDEREFLEGDLIEEYRRRAATDGVHAARRWLWRQTIAAAATNHRLDRFRDAEWRKERMRPMKGLLQDLRYGARMLRRQPGYSAVVVLTLALAIGANTVIFSFANLLLLRPLPIRQSDRVAWIWGVDPKRGERRGLVSIPDFLELRASVAALELLGAGMPGTYTMTGRGDAVRLTASCITANQLDVWGVPVILGRSFVDGEDRPGAAAVVILSHQFWAKQFASDPHVIGHPLTLDGRPHVVVGVLDPSIEIGNLTRIDIWTPLTLDASVARDRRELRLVGRMRPGATLEQVDAQVRATADRLARTYPQADAGWSARAVSTRQAIVGESTWPILGLLGLVVSFVLLIACANIANLVLARGTTRRRELAVRTALGAGRLRMVRQLVTENLILGLLGGAAGLAIAAAGLRIIVATAYEPFFQSIGLDRPVLVFTALLSVLTPILFSLLPALQATRSDVNETLKESSNRAGGGLRGRRSRSVLVVSQLALALALLIVSTLLIRTMIAYNNAPLGFAPKNLLTMQTELPEWRYGSDASVRSYYERVTARLRALPGVTGVATVSRLPVLNVPSPETIDVEGRAEPRPEDRAWAAPSTASAGFFETAGIPLLAGRTFNAEDRETTRRVAVINQEMARRYWGNTAASLGGHVTRRGRAAGSTRYEVIGVVGNTVRPDLEGADPQMFVSAEQEPARAMAWMVRSDRANELKAAIRAALRSADRDVAVYMLRTVGEAFQEDVSSNRLITGLFGSFAALALALAAVGLYSVISYSVNERSHEIGIRLALGAVPGDIRRLVVGQTLALVTVGLVLGLAAGAVIARLSSGVLYGVSSSDPGIYAGVTGLLVLVAVLAAYAPARRATRVDPVRALRTE